MGRGYKTQGETGSGLILQNETRPRFCPEDRQKFISAGELKSGERMRPHRDGATTTVVKAVPLPGVHTVYNLQIHGEHVYEVSELGVLVHNSYRPRGTAAANRAENIAKGIPESALGPSGKPKIHVKKFPNRKRAQNAAQNRSRRGGTPEEHPNPTTGEPHYHPDGSNHREHYEYPRKGFPQNLEH